MANGNGNDKMDWFEFIVKMTTIVGPIVIIYLQLTLGKEAKDAADVAALQAASANHFAAKNDEQLDEIVRTALSTNRDINDWRAEETNSSEAMAKVEIIDAKLEQMEVTAALPASPAP
jgi:hypothetical protein